MRLLVGCAWGLVSVATPLVGQEDARSFLLQSQERLGNAISPLDRQAHFEWFASVGAYHTADSILAAWELSAKPRFHPIEQRLWLMTRRPGNDAKALELGETWLTNNPYALQSGPVKDFLAQIRSWMIARSAVESSRKASFWGPFWALLGFASLLWYAPRLLSRMV